MPVYRSQLHIVHSCVGRDRVRKDSCVCNTHSGEAYKTPTRGTLAQKRNWCFGDLTYSVSRLFIYWFIAPDYFVTVNLRRKSTLYFLSFPRLNLPLKFLLRLTTVLPPIHHRPIHHHSFLSQVQPLLPSKTFRDS